jgi:dTDP-4-amino-4,6-dideoxygalactose transaminase
MDPAKIASAITPKTRAIVPVHIYGQCANMDPILTVAAKHDLYVIEDAAQAQGSSYRGRNAGSMGHLGCFSFYPAKNLGACGDAGAVVTGDPRLNEKLRMLRNYGQSRKYHHDMMGFNSRLDDLQAAILRVKLRYLDDWNERRRRAAEIYLSNLNDRFSPPKTPADSIHNYHLFVIQSDYRDRLQKQLNQHGVETLVHYPVPIHKQAALQGVAHRDCGLSATERIAERVLSLPVFPTISHGQVTYVLARVNAFPERSTAETQQVDVPAYHIGAIS